MDSFNEGILVKSITDSVVKRLRSISDGLFSIVSAKKESAITWPNSAPVCFGFSLSEEIISSYFQPYPTSISSDATR